MEEVQREVHRLFRQQQEKYVYYLIALSVAAIGFSVYKTTGVRLKWIQVPLGMSVVCWGLSIFHGLGFLKYVMSVLHAYNSLIDIVNGIDPKVGVYSENVSVSTKDLLAKMNKHNDRASLFLNRQERLFYLAIVLFIIWHVLEMYYQL